MNSIRLLLPAMLALFFSLSCSEKPVDVTLNVAATLAGKPLAGAKVMVDGVASGETDAHGKLPVALSRMRGFHGKIAVTMEAAETRAKPWEGEYAIATDEKAQGAIYNVEATLRGFVTVIVTSAGKPLANAVIRDNKKELGRSDAVGEFEYDFDAWPESGMVVSVGKEDYVTEKLVLEGVSGKRFAVDLYERAIIRVKSMREENGHATPLAGSVVFLDGNQIGVTDDGGNLVYRHKGAHGKSATLMIKVKDHVPAQVQDKVELAGKSNITRYFYPEQASPVRLGVYEFVSNTANANISEVVDRVAGKFVEELKAETGAFAILDRNELKRLISSSKTNIDKLKQKGWQQKPLANAMDVLAIGSVSKDESDGYYIEVSMFRNDGRLIMSHVGHASGDSNWRIGRAISDIVENIVERYPFEAVITGGGADEFRINMGKKVFPITDDDVFSVRAVNRDPGGRATDEEIGALKVRNRKPLFTNLAVEGMTKDRKPQIGDKVVRLDSAQQRTTNYVSLLVKGGVDDSRVPLSGVNVYAAKKWIGVTDMSGKLDIPARIGKDVDVVLYRHGFKQVAKTLDAQSKGQVFELAMESFNSNLNLASDPNGAKVYIDEQNIGSTPLAQPYPIPLGFHNLRIAKGGDYRDWEEVVEFNKHEENMTGDHKVVLYKDWVRIGDRAYENHDLVGAIEAYRSANRDHPDFAESHHRLARMYMDEKGDYDAAITEFESVLEVPEVKQLILKQYAVVYTNLGHAYFAKGEQVQDKDKDAAAKYFAKAISVLGKARENSRFFPNENYDEIIHDTYYYLAMSYHYLYTITHNEAILGNADLAWQQYFDFFPQKLEDREEFARIKNAARQLWDQIKSKA